MALPLEPESGLFPETEIPPFTAAPEVEEFAQDVLRAHKELASLAQAVLDDEEIRLAYVFDNAPFDPTKDEVKHATMGKAMKASPVWKLLSEVEAVVVIRAWFWERFDARQRGALLMHELLHIEPQAPGKVALSPHSIEEFSAVMRRYGAYLPDRAAFIAEWARWESDQGGKPKSGPASLSQRTLDRAVDMVNAGALGPNVTAYRPGEELRVDPDIARRAEDDEDLRPTGDVNPDALRGEAERATEAEKAELDEASAWFDTLYSQAADRVAAKRYARVKGAGFTPGQAAAAAAELERDFDEPVH